MLEIEKISREDFKMDLNWLAGFIDGEGCFYLGFNICCDREEPRKTLRTLVLVGNSMVEPMIKVSRILKNNGIGFSVGLKRFSNPKWSDSLSIKVCGQGRCYKLSKLLLPYLICKKEQAVQMINVIQYRKFLAEKNGITNKHIPLIKNPILNLMSKRMKELNGFREDLTSYSRKPGEIIHNKKPSQTARLTALSYEDCFKVDDTVGAFVKAEEADRNDLLIANVN